MLHAYAAKFSITVEKFLVFGKLQPQPRQILTVHKATTFIIKCINHRNHKSSTPYTHAGMFHNEFELATMNSNSPQ